MGFPGAAPPRLITLCGGRKLVLMPIVMLPRSDSTGRRRVRVQAIARVFRWRGIPDSEAFSTIIEEVAAEKINSNHASRMLRRTLLASQTVEAHDGA